MLWTTPAIGFMPHCAPGDPLAPVTPVIVDHEGATPPHDEVLLNLRGEWPPFFSRFQRLIEIVGLDDGDRDAGPRAASATTATAATRSGPTISARLSDQ